MERLLFRGIASLNLLYAFIAEVQAEEYDAYGGTLAIKGKATRRNGNKASSIPQASPIRIC